jgi:hypothetical protein
MPSAQRSLLKTSQTLTALLHPQQRQSALQAWTLPVVQPVVCPLAADADLPRKGGRIAEVDR